MKIERNKRPKVIIDLNLINTLSEGCPACGMKFSLGDMTVPAIGSWGGPKLIHENEAVFDEKAQCYVERRHFKAMHPEAE
jgi:hypothetical protein